MKLWVDGLEQNHDIKTIEESELKLLDGIEMKGIRLRNENLEQNCK